MRKLLKKIIPEKQRRQLNQLEQKVKGAVKGAQATALNKLLSDKVKVGLKSSLQVIARLDYDKCDIFLNIDSDIEYSTRLHSCKKEPEMIRWIETILKPGDVLYDIGANVGAYTLVAAKYHQAKVKIYAFEPSFLNFVKLSKNILTNHTQGCVTPMQIALSDETTLGTFNYNNLTPGGAMHAFGQAVDYKGDAFVPVYQQEVFSYTMDDLIKRFKIPVPNHIKMDVDGIEFKILKGATETLEYPSLKSIIIELDEGDEESSRTVQFLKERGLEYRSKHKYTAADDTGPFSKMYNYIFERVRR